MLPQRRRLAGLAVVVLLTCAAGLALAQESGSDLALPSPQDGSRPVQTPEEAYQPRETPPPPGPDEAAPVPEVPPPPAESPPPPSYGESGERRYPSGGGEASAEGVRVPSRVATRLRVLSDDFSALAGRGSSALVDGILSIVTGGLAVTLGILIDDEFLSPYLYVYGGASVARGVIDIALVPNASDPAIAFSHMPMGTLGEVRTRLTFGEEELESLATRTRIARILDASISMAAGIAIVPLYLGPNDMKVSDAYGVFIIIGAGISVITGLINLLTRSEAERRWAAYEELDERLGPSEDLASTPSWDLAAVPLPGGGAFALGARF